MELIFVSFLAGVLTVLAPCVLALLPVILGGTLGQQNPYRPLIIAVSLGISVIIFTLLLKFLTTFAGVPQQTLIIIAGALVAVFGLTMVFPRTWEKIAFKLKLYKSENLIEESNKHQGNKGAILLGASLGPVFSSCSPTYTIIIAIVLPQDFVTGLINLFAYTLGLVLLLLVIGYAGQKATKKLRALANPYGWFKKFLGVLLVLTGIAVASGLDKDLEAYILESGYLGPIDIENSLLENVDLDQ